MNNLQKLVRSNIQAMKPYVSARSLDFKGELFLDANESPNEDTHLFNRYPEPQPQALISRLSQLYRVPKEMIFAGRGSDEAIDLVIRAFCEPKQDKILICPPTYGMYEVSANIQNIQTIHAPLMLVDESFILDETAILKTLDGNPEIKVLFLCSPNNPTGTSFKIDSLDRIYRLTQGRCLVVLDEAYAEFDSQTQANENLGRLNTYPNMIILRTFSKAWALAGVRCGVALASSEIIQILQKIRPPYPISSPAAASILKATDSTHQELLEIRIRSILTEKQRLFKELQELECVDRVFSASTNFILVRFKESEEILNYTRSYGIILRDRSFERNLENCVRITVGSPVENRILISCLKDYSLIGKNGQRPIFIEVRNEPQNEKSLALVFPSRPEGRGPPRVDEAFHDSLKWTKYLFLDRDGTLIEEPEDQQIDSFSKFKLLPDVIPSLIALQNSGYRLVMVSNQDGLGSDEYPQARFEMIQNMLLELFKSQGIIFESILICPHRENERCVCRKPQLGLLHNYLSLPELDRKSSYVIGDRTTDLSLAENMRINGIQITPGKGWKSITSTLLMQDREGTALRKTKETHIHAYVNLNPKASVAISTGIGFLNHMGWIGICFDG